MSSDDSENPPSRRLWLKVSLSFAAVAAVLALGAYTYEHTIGLTNAKARYAQSLADWKAAGLPDPASWHTPPPPAPPDAQNLFKQPAFDGLAIIYSGNTFPSTRWDDIGSIAFAPADNRFCFDADHILAAKNKPKLLPAAVPGVPAADTLVAALETAFPELKILVESEARCPTGTYPDFDRSPPLHTWPSPSFKSARGNAVTLTAYAGAKLLQGDGRPALATVRALALRHRQSGHCPTLVSAMIDNVINSLALPRLVHTGLARGVWSDADLAGLETTLASVSPAAALATAMMAETEFGSEFLIGWAEGTLPAYPVLVTPAFAFPSTCYRAAAHHRDAMRQIVVPLRATPAWDISRMVATHDALALAPITAENRLTQLGIPAFTKVAANCAAGALRIHSARIAIALERHRRAHGTYPETLDALTPAYLAALPANVWAGHARAYTRTATGYKLTWPASDYTDSFDRTDTHHPGPWDIAGYKLELPDAITWFDTHTVTPGKPPVDIVWEMKPPAP